MKIKISAECAGVFAGFESKQRIRLLDHNMDNKHYRKLKLIRMIILTVVLIHLGWLLIELSNLKSLQASLIR